MARKSTKKCDPLLMLHGRILLRGRDGEITDVTEESAYALKKFAEDGSLVIHILNQCRKRLDLLSMAAENRSQMDASLVRLAIQDVQADLEDGSDLHGYIHLTQEMFEHSEALPPIPMPGTWSAGRSFTVVKPAS
ncbi:MAG: hypothetical protein A4E19_05980 [Nitrospira sp. SG-bin1]|nr:MAG: hypothetical protein A4E19_05980 [Nitrospira sp. SG-bin1]